MNTLLVVEDEPSVLSLICTVAGKCGHRVLKAGNGERALGMAQTGSSFDALVSDVLMPGMDGFEMARRICSDKPGIPMLFISGQVGYQQFPLDFQGRPHVHYMSKPFSPWTLEQMFTRLFSPAYG